MTPFAALFLIAVAASAALRLWLASRHVRHVVAHRNAVPDEFASAIALEAHQKAADYSAARTRFSMLHALFDVGLLLVLTFGGLLQAIYDVASLVTTIELLRGVVFFALLGLLLTLIELPFDWYRTFVIEERFGFNKMTPALFLADMIKGLAVAAVFGLPFLAFLLWLMSAAGSLWWLYAWATGLAYWVFVQFISPTVIAPLFNKFSPLADDSLRSRIEQLLARCGFQSKGLFVMDGSRRSSHGNAYFTGFGRNKRIVFFDTLIQRHGAGEIEAVLAHELGHFRLRHVLKLTALLGVLGFAFFWVLGQIQHQPWFFESLNTRYPAPDALVLTLLYVALPPFLFFVRPLLAAYLRRNEFEADAYAAQHSSAAELANALVRLYKDNASTLTPDPVHSAFYDSHPPARARIARLKALAGAAPSPSPA
jgi:STE24 endopeptidase